MGTDSPSRPDGDHEERRVDVSASQHPTNVSLWPSIRDRLRVNSYLTRLDWHLEGTVSSITRKKVLRTLREDLAIEPRGVRVALHDLGPASSLAAQYAEGERPRPLWSIGIITAGAALLIYWGIFYTYTLGMLAVVESNAIEEADSVFLFINVTAFSSQDAIGIGWHGGIAWLLVPITILTLAYIFGSRLWRIFQLRRQ